MRKPSALVLGVILLGSGAGAAAAEDAHDRSNAESDPAPEHMGDEPAEESDGDSPVSDFVDRVTALMSDVDLQLHGFVSQGFIYSIGNNYLARSRKGSFEMTEAALNLSVTPLDGLTTSMQLFTRDLGPIGNYTVKLDWFQLDWRPFDELGIRAGRVRMPFGLYNATSDYDPARVPVLLPQSVYPTTSRDFLLAVTGGEIYGTLGLGPVGYLEYRAYGGAIFIDSDPATQPFTVNIPWTVGGRLMWETPLSGLRLAGSALGTELRSEIAGLDYRIPAVLWLASAEYQAGIFLVAAEYGRQHTRIEIGGPVAPPPQELESELYYLMLNVEIASWLKVGTYYAGAFYDLTARLDPTLYRHDVAGTLRFDINSFWLVKLEGHYMHGTAGTTDQLNRRPIDQRPVDWAVFMIKTTAYF